MTGGIFELDKQLERLNQLNLAMMDENLWQDPQKISQLRSEAASIEREITPWLQLKTKIEDLVEYINLAEEENDQPVLINLEKEYYTFSKELEDLELYILLKGETDHCNAYLNIHPGAGGTESQDWAEMLLRMYQRWAIKNGFTVDIVALEQGEEAGIKEATLLIKGKYAFGYLTAENGIHRLVRLSPFNAQNKRQTSFCGISVSPEIDDSIEINIDDKDLRIDTFRASGAGGQHVNKVSSAVRITHIPTGLTATCQSERSQFQNKDTAMSILRSKLYALEKAKRDQENSEKSLDRKSVEWGNQIRSYTFQPSVIIKDHRTNLEKNNAQAILDGEIDDFIIAWLKMFKAKNY
ncbi:MAG: peptide chain release factor 2 [Brevinemataceae bacterium]